jgi:hypothetical protein
MTKSERARQSHQIDTLIRLGFTYDEAEKLRLISMRLHRWYELECGSDNGCIERDEATGRPLWRNSFNGNTYPVPDCEKGALKRLQAIIDARNVRAARDERPEVYTYLQTDPRGASLYIIRPGDVPQDGSVDSYYTRGICVY